ncbi:MAG: hypothetical protein PHI40_00910 [Caldisericia bacterium]|nr:hypothetical protein [Caldisericia bacterium]MDD4613955.1 hypothetical protein [Caldisericia bacterium]
MYTAFLVLIILLLFLGLVYLFHFLFILKNRPSKTNIRSRFFAALTLGFDKGLVQNLDNVVDIYKGLSIVNEEEDYRNNLSTLMRQYLVEVLSKCKNAKRSEEKCNIDIATKLTDFIRLNENLAPYTDLPLEERTIFNDIAIFLEKKDIDSVKRKILELQGTIKVRYDDLERLRSINNLSVPLAIISVVLTIFFGIVAWDNPALREIFIKFLP